MTVTETIVRKKVLLELPCPLTDFEVLAKAKQKANAELELEELLAELADVKRGWSKRIEEKEKTIAQWGAEIRTGDEKRVIECYERYQSEGEHRGKIETIRKDTAEVVSRRAADLLEARQAVPDADDSDDADADVLAAAAKSQRDAGVEEDEDGDVVAPAGEGKRTRKVRKK